MFANLPGIPQTTLVLVCHALIVPRTPAIATIIAFLDVQVRRE